MGLPIDDGAVKQHFPMVHKRARQLQSRIRDNSISYDDLFSEGCIGLVKALETYDPSTGFQFSTLAYHTIFGYIQRFLDSNGAIRFPAHVPMLANRILKAELQDASPEVIAEKLGSTEYRAQLALEYMQHRELYSLDMPRTDPKNHSDTDEDHTYLAKAEMDVSYLAVEDFLNSLDHKRRTVVEMLMRGFERKEIAAQLRCSKQYIFAILESIQKLYSKYERAKVIPFVKREEPDMKKEGPSCGLTRQALIEALAAGETFSSIERAWGMKYNTIQYWVKDWGLKGINSEKAARILQEEGISVVSASPQSPEPELPEQAQEVKVTDIGATESDSSAKPAEDNRDVIRNLKREIEQLMANNVKAVALAGKSAEKAEKEHEQLKNQICELQQKLAAATDPVTPSTGVVPLPRTRRSMEVEVAGEQDEIVEEISAILAYLKAAKGGKTFVLAMRLGEGPHCQHG